MDLPLIAGFAPQAPLVWRGVTAVSQAQFLGQVQRLAGALPASTPIINLCADAHRFMLGLAASALRESVTLMPPSAADSAVAALRAQYPRAVVLADADVDLAPAPPATAVPALPSGRVVAIAFTSGSTGASQPQPKTWHTLAAIGRLASDRLLQGRAASLVATVPPQHMYGLETTVLMALGAGCATHATRPFFPEDVARVLGDLPAPRVLITTPVHLRALVAAGTRLPELALIVSATAPLATALAAQAEALLGAPVHEIFGCTEAGSMATRRTISGEPWLLYPGMQVRDEGGRARLDGVHLPAPVHLSDVLTIESPHTFRVVSRGSDLLKVAGKRASLADLTQKLLAVPGVEDAVVFMPEEGPTARPAALVVAPQLSDAHILDALARVIDPVFLPRPLRRVAQLPRNEVGKLPRASLIAALRDP